MEPIGTLQTVSLGRWVNKEEWPSSSSGSCQFWAGFRRFPNGYTGVSEGEFSKEKTVVDRDRSSRIERAAQGAQGAQAQWLGMLQTLAAQIQRW